MKPDIRVFVGILLCLILVGIPFRNDAYVLSVGLDIALFTVLAIGMNIVVGYAGLLDLGYAAFYAIGAYVTGVLMQDTSLSFWLIWPLAGIVAGIFGMIIGAPTLRLRTDYLAIVTLGFGEITRLTITNLSVTGGPTGLYNVRPPQIFNHTLQDPIEFYIMALAMVAIGIAFSLYIRRTWLGAAWMYVKHDDEVAQAVGVNPFTTKLWAYGLGAVWGGLSGAVFVEALTAVSPTSFTFDESLSIVIAVILGGQGSVAGAMLGAFLVVGIPELFRPLSSWRLLGYGFMLIVFMLVRPGGMLHDKIFEARLRPRLNDSEKGGEQTVRAS